MKPFVDSSGIAGDGSELRRRMDRDGYLYVRGLLPRELLEELRLKWLRVLEEVGWVKEEGAGAEGVANLKAFCVEPERPYMEVMTRVLSIMEFQAIQHHPDLLAVVERLLGGRVLPHPRLIGRTIFPQKVEYTTPPHQDWVPIQGTAQTYTAWFPVSDLAGEMGGLQLSTGSHRGGVYEFRPALGAGGMEVTDKLEGDWVHNPVEQGDVLFFHSLMVHKGVANRSNWLRLSMDARFQRVDQPIAPGSLEPHGREVRNWEQVYADWPPGSRLKYYWRQYPLKVQPFDPSYFEKRDRMGLEMGAAGDPRARSVLQRIVAREVQTANILYIINRKHGLHIDRVSTEEDKPMPWKETCTMDQRMLFIVDYLSGGYTKKGLCRHYGISRPTGDKWIDRYRIHGPEGLDDLSRRPGCHPDTTAPEIVERIIETKLAHQSFGPKKVMDRLRALEPDEVWPADSTAGKILKRNHLVRERRQRRRVPPDPRALVHCNAPAQSWSADFKGDVPLANGKRCYPLTLTDNHSRFILQCRALSHPTTDAVKPWFEWVFREYGLPETLRTDNGPPFASVAAGGLSQLSKWWIRLGIRPERIRPAKPSENGRHERMHRSLKEAVMRPPARTLSAQQRRFDAFVEEFNWQRSHEALGRLTPASVHQPSPRPYPERLPEVEYPSGVTVRRVRRTGEFKWRGRLIYLSTVLAKETIALVPCDNDRWEIRYSSHPLGVFDQPTQKIVPAQQWHQRE